MLKKIVKNMHLVLNKSSELRAKILKVPGSWPGLCWGAGLRDSGHPRVLSRIHLSGKIFFHENRRAPKTRAETRWKLLAQKPGLKNRPVPIPALLKIKFL